MTTTTAMPPQGAGSLATAASLIATAALVDAAGTTDVRVVVCGTNIGIQVPPGAGDQALREATVAAYARVLGAQVTREHHRNRIEAWTETRGVIGGLDVHVWTITDPSQEP
jgi:hypothetical protein